MPQIVQPDALAAVDGCCGPLEGIAALSKRQPATSTRGWEHQVFLASADELGFEQLRYFNGMSASRMP